MAGAAAGSFDMPVAPRRTGVSRSAETAFPMKGIIRKIDLALRGAIIFLTGAILVVICLQVFCRFILGSALSWPEEAARFLMIWALLLAGAYALNDGEHVGLNFFVNRFPESVQRVLRIIMNVFVIGFLLVMVSGGYTEAMTLIKLKTGALRISRAIPYMIIPISGIIYIIITLRLIIADAKAQSSK